MKTKFKWINRTIGLLIMIVSIFFLSYRNITTTSIMPILSVFLCLIMFFILKSKDPNSTGYYIISTDDILNNEQEKEFFSELLRQNIISTIPCLIVPVLYFDNIIKIILTVLLICWPFLITTSIMMVVNKQHY